jgi:hypothetical protein
MSGAKAQAADNIQKRKGSRRLEYARPTAIAVMACENADGMVTSLGGVT